MTKQQGNRKLKAKEWVWLVCMSEQRWEQGLAREQVMILEMSGRWIPVIWVNYWRYLLLQAWKKPPAYGWHPTVQDNLDWPSGTLQWAMDPRWNWTAPKNSPQGCTFPVNQVLHTPFILTSVSELGPPNKIVQQTQVGWDCQVCQLKQACAVGTDGFGSKDSRHSERRSARIE